MQNTAVATLGQDSSAGVTDTSSPTANDQIREQPDLAPAPFQFYALPRDVLSSSMPTIKRVQARLSQPPCQTLGDQVLREGSGKQ